jgi:hypothetical protein
LYAENLRSAIPDDLTNADIEFFIGIIDVVDNIWLKARLADIVWFKKSPPDPKFACIAIDAYRFISLDFKTWVHGGRECWERAIRLAQMLKSGAGNRLGQIEREIVDSFNIATLQDDPLRFATILKQNKLGRGNSVDIAQKLETFAHEQENIFHACEYFAASEEWYSMAPDRNKAAKVTAAHAECLIKIAESATSNIVAAQYYEQAIQVYRTIPNSERDNLYVDKKISELKERLNNAGQNSIAEMGVLRRPCGILFPPYFPDVLTR